MSFESSTLGRLPLELIIHIGDYLTPISAACFSLSCKYIYALLGSDLSSNSETRDYTKEDMIKLLARGSSRHIFCTQCAKLHTISQASNYVFALRQTGRRQPSCLRLDRTDGSLKYINSRFSHIVCQMVMQLYRLGEDYTGLLDLLSHTEEIQRGLHKVEKISSLARISEDRILVRTQTLFLLSPPPPPPPDGKSKSKAKPTPIEFRVCPHLQLFKAIPGPAGRISKNKQDAQNPELGFQRLWGKLRKCESCMTEFQCNYKDLGERGEMVSFTKWQDLGDGKRICWKAIPGAVRGVEEWKGSIYRAFQGEDGFNFRALEAVECPKRSLRSCKKGKKRGKK
ncbi:hypothetical protein F5884DRAFT_33218 [Xylogone sp. PMI_703]|nr:hypothetical protein F5884DRAFT_33218 [Xylogone sp. PMI_703]